VTVASVETDRLVLRPFTLDDLDELAAAFAVEAVWFFPFRRGLTRAETEGFLQRTNDYYDRDGVGPWAARTKAPGALIGYVGLSVPHFLPEVLPAVEVGWRLHPDWWGQGLATEGARASVRFGFETLRLDRLISIYEPANVASGRVMDHLGLTFERATVGPRGEKIHVRELFRQDWDRTMSGQYRLFEPSEQEPPKRSGGGDADGSASR
jgi:RimJ/RimL family protein N-acetyltransferase